MDEPQTLPDLQARLDGLEPGDVVYMARKEFARLFGTNDAALGRLKIFVEGHNCAATWDKAGLKLRKQKKTLAEKS